MTISMYVQNLIKINQFVLKILSRNEILTSIKDHNSVFNLQKLTCNNLNLDLVNIYAYVKLGQIPSINFLDLSRNKILISLKGHNSITIQTDMKQSQPGSCQYQLMHMQNLVEFQQFILKTSIKDHNSITNYKLQTDENLHQQPQPRSCLYQCRFKIW